MKKNKRGEMAKKISEKKIADLSIDKDSKDLLYLTFTGNLNSTTTGTLWEKVIKVLAGSSPDKIICDASKIQYCDMSGIALFLEIKNKQEINNLKFEIKGLKKEFQKLLSLFEAKEPDTDQKKHIQKSNFIVDTGKSFIEILYDIKHLISFVGEVFQAFLYMCYRPFSFRWKDAFLVAERAGVNALPIVILISFLIGLIMAFQAAMPMRKFGAEIFVADLIGLSMLRELGPLMTAIVLAGRSGSSFAAEIGTMKVNEEIDALTTMGLDPVRFLVVVRIFAAMIITPALTVFADLVGIIGGSIPLVSMGYPVVRYYNKMMQTVDYLDFSTGLFKAFVFGVLIAGVGCLRGLETKTGASAVGVSTTSAVVSSIILIVIFDGIFSVLFYYLKI